jgi:hypothetical protein
MPRPGAFGRRVKRKAVIVGDNVNGSCRKRVQLSRVETSDPRGEQGDHFGMFLSPDTSASGANMNSLHSNHELDSLQLDQEDDSAGMVIDDANKLPSSCVSPDEVVEDSSESNREAPSGSESQDSEVMDSRKDCDADIAISINDVDESIRGAREPVITNSLFSKAALYRIAKPVIDELQKLILNLMHAGYKGAIHHIRRTSGVLTVLNNLLIISQHESKPFSEFPT